MRVLRYIVFFASVSGFFGGLYMLIESANQSIHAVGAIKMNSDIRFWLIVMSASVVTLAIDVLLYIYWPCIVPRKNAVLAEAPVAAPVDDLVEELDQEVGEELVELWDGTKPWQPSPARQREREEAWRQQ